MSSSTYTGVSFVKASNKWRSKIFINGKSKHLGVFNDEIDAAKAYQIALKGIKNLKSRRIVNGISKVLKSANGNWYYSRTNNFGEYKRLDFKHKFEAMYNRDIDLDKYVIEGSKAFPLTCKIPSLKNITKSKSFLHEISKEITKINRDKKD